MAEALYRKYRPQTFEDVVGQTHIERTLKNAIESDKVSHAYLFCGPRGTGKTTTARLLAKALLCECGPTPSPDGTCEQCLAIADGTHPDVSELDAASRTGVENVREEIIGRVQYAPTRGRYKIYIVDEVHMLSTAAFNALLKTLEEPPGHVVFILCTTDPQRVPETIHSRCQRFDFHRLSTDEIVSRLGAVCVAEDVEFEGDALDLIAHRAQGGMRDALTSLEQLIAFGGGKVTVEVAQSVLGSIDTDDMSEVVDFISARDAAACFTWLSRYVETGADLARFARDLASYVRDLYVLALTDGAMAIDAPQASRAAMAEQSKAFGTDRLAYVLRVLGDLNAELRSAVNPRLSFEIALTRMVRPESDLTLESLAARVAELEAALASGVAVSSMPVPARLATSEDSFRAAFGAGADRADDGRSLAKEAAVSSVLQEMPPSSLPPVSSGYRSSSSRSNAQNAPSAAPSKAVASAAAAMDRASAFRAQLERRRSSQAPSAGSAAVRASQGLAPRSEDAASFAQGSASSDSSAVSGFTAGEEVKAKIADPSSLQRGWQMAVSDLKRRRAAYGALMLSARVVGRPGGEGIAIEFSKENSFAFSAARKPDISAAIAEALQASFGGPVPFEITQGDSDSSATMAARARAVAAQVSARASAERAPSPTPQAAPAVAAPPYDDAVPYSDADAVPYDDADAVPYTDADVESYAPWDDIPAAHAAQAHPNASTASARPSGADAGSAVASSASNSLEVLSPEPAEETPAAAPDAESETNAEMAEFALSIDGPRPVDPYKIGKKLGFDSMPDPKKKAKGLMRPKGWPGFESKKNPSQAKAEHPGMQAVETMRPAESIDSGDASLKTAAEAGDRAVSATGPSQALLQQRRGANTIDAPAVAGSSEPADSLGTDGGMPSLVASSTPARPNPFASRSMPAGIGNPSAVKMEEPAPSAVLASGEGAMDAADIFGSFGVSFEQVQEEN